MQSHINEWTRESNEYLSQHFIDNFQRIAVGSADCVFFKRILPKMRKLRVFQNKFQMSKCLY